MNGGAQSYHHVPASPTEEQIVAALWALERRGYEDSDERLVLEVNFHIPDKYRWIKGRARARLIASLINALNADVPKLKDVRDNDARLGVVKAFLKTSEGGFWMKRRTGQSGDSAYADILPTSISARSARTALEAQSVPGGFGDEGALTSTVHRDQEQSEGHIGVSAPVLFVMLFIFLLFILAYWLLSVEMERV